MKPADWAWVTLAAGVAAYDILAPTGETMSEGCDRIRAKHPILTHLVIAAVAGHLTRLLPYRADPLHGFGLIVVRTKGIHDPGR